MGHNTDSQQVNAVNGYYVPRIQDAFYIRQAPVTEDASDMNGGLRYADPPYITNLLFFPNIRFLLLLEHEVHTSSYP